MATLLTMLVLLTLFLALVVLVVVSLVAWLLATAWGRRWRRWIFEALKRRNDDHQG